LGGNDLFSCAFKYSIKSLIEVTSFDQIPEFSIPGGGK
jgi:hypothetical protein